MVKVVAVKVNKHVASLKREYRRAKELFLTVAVCISANLFHAGECFAEGEKIFGDAACTLLDAVISYHYGAMITVIAGGLAIVASVMGSFKGAWALLFVSIGCFIFPHLVGEVFPDLSCTGGG